MFCIPQLTFTLFLLDHCSLFKTYCMKTSCSEVTGSLVLFGFRSFSLSLEHLRCQYHLAGRLKVQQPLVLKIINSAKPFTNSTTSKRTEMHSVLFQMDGLFWINNEPNTLSMLCFSNSKYCVSFTPAVLLTSWQGTWWATSTTSSCSNIP